MFKLRLLTLPALIVSGSSCVYAGPVTWTLQSITLQQGALSGYFVYDADANAYTDWSITIPAEASPWNMAAETLTPANSMTTGQSPNSRRFKVVDLTGTDIFAFFFAGALTDAGGTDTVCSPVSAFCNSSFAQNLYNGTSDPITGGSFVGAAAPEPAPAALCLGAVAAILATRLRGRTPASGR